MLEAVEAGQKIAIFQIHVNYFLFWQNLIFWKILLPQHYTCWIVLVFTYIWSISLFKIAQLQESEMRPTGWTLSYRRSNLFETRQMGKVVQHRKIMLNSLPDLLRGVASHQTQIVTPLSNWLQQRQRCAGAVKKFTFSQKVDKISFEWNLWFWLFTTSITF